MLAQQPDPKQPEGVRVATRSPGEGPQSGDRLLQHHAHWLARARADVQLNRLMATSTPGFTLRHRITGAGTPSIYTPFFCILEMRPGSYSRMFVPVFSHGFK